MFKSPATLKKQLQETFPNDIPSTSNFQLGYLEGNTKRWIIEEKDLSVMYNRFTKGSKITLRCDGISDNSCPPEVGPPSKRRKTTSCDLSSLCDAGVMRFSRS